MYGHASNSIHARDSLALDALIGELDFDTKHSSGDKFGCFDTASTRCGTPVDAFSHATTPDYGSVPGTPQSNLTDMPFETTHESHWQSPSHLHGYPPAPGAAPVAAPPVAINVMEFASTAPVPVHGVSCWTPTIEVQPACEEPTTQRPWTTDGTDCRPLGYTDHHRSSGEVSNFSNLHVESTGDQAPMTHVRATSPGRSAFARIRGAFSPLRRRSNRSPSPAPSRELHSSTCKAPDLMDVQGTWICRGQEVVICGSSISWATGASARIVADYAQFRMVGQNGKTCLTGELSETGLRWGDGNVWYRAS